MVMFAVKNDKGEWLSFDPSHESLWHTNNPTFFNDKSYAEAQNTGLDGIHVVELVDAPAKIVVSEDEAEMLEKAKDTTVWRPAAVISKYAYNAEKDSDQEALLEDRLMRAYVIGWTVEKPKRYVLPMPDGTDDEDQEDMQYVAVNRSYYAGPVWFQGPRVTFQQAQARYSVTQAEIDTAPDWVKAITPVEVTDDDD